MNLLRIAFLMLLGVSLTACGKADAQAEGGLPKEAASLIDMMGPDQKLEMGFLADGSFDDVEFHVPFERLPAEVRAALEKHIPGGKVLDAEIEFSKGVKSYEVTKEIDGLEQEVLVDEKGAVVEWEIQVPDSKVPDAVKKSAETASPGEVTAWEEIRDSAKKLTAYHVKKDDAGRKYKIAIDPAGAVKFVRREVVAEAEVTIR